jgi:hypothetical protein
MQEEVTGKSIALIISSAKMTEQVLDRAIRAYLNRKKQPKIYRGKQTLKQLLKLVLADNSRLSASDGQEPEKTEILR